MVQALYEARQKRVVKKNAATSIARLLSKPFKLGWPVPILTAISTGGVMVQFVTALVINHGGVLRIAYGRPRNT